jgi:hypothetical protein
MQLVPLQVTVVLGRAAHGVHKVPQLSTLFLGWQVPLQS